MKKRVFGFLLSAALILSAMGFAVPMTAMADSMMVVTVGADLTEEQKNMILNYFNVAGQSYTTIVVTNADEWAHLGGYMSRDIVGYRTISCALIRPMTSGGIQVKTANLTYVTSNMIASNLATAGVTNCEVLAAAPFQVSGTGALTGALMAYENLSGVTLDQSKKQIAMQEFATTYELGQTIGQQEAQQIVNDVKMQVINGTLEEDNSVTYEEITKIVNDVVNNYTTNYTNNYTTNNTTNNNTTNTTNITNNTSLSPEDIESLQQLALEIAQQSYEQGTINALAQIQKTLEGQTMTMSTAATTEIEESASPTVEIAAEPDSPEAETQSAADQALSQDSLLTNTNESALASTTETGSVISSSTAESAINEEVATNLDAQLEEQKAAAMQQEAQPEAPLQPEAPVSQQYFIPEPEDVTVLPGPQEAWQQEEQPQPEQAQPEQPQPEQPQPEQPQPEQAQPEQPQPEQAQPEQLQPEQPQPEQLQPEQPQPFEQQEEQNPPMEQLPDQIQPGEEPQPVDQWQEEGQPAGEMQQEGQLGEELQQDGQPGEELQQDGQPAGEEGQTIILTDADIENGTVSFGVSSEAEDGLAPASGVAPVAVTVPYTGLSLSSGVLRVTDDESGEMDVADVEIVPGEPNVVLVENGDSTTILMVPKSLSDKSDFSPAAGKHYTYSLDAEFDMNTGTGEKLSLQFLMYDPYDEPVSEKGFSVNGSCLNRNAAEMVTGSVLFPSDAGYATVTADAADVTVTSGMDGSLVNGATIYANDTVSISAYQSGPVKLTITYYAQNPDAFTAVEEGYSEEGYSEEGSYEEGAMDQAPIEPIGTAQYTIWFN